MTPGEFGRKKEAFMSAKTFYNSRIWKALRKQKLLSDPICEYCKRRPATQVDHRKAIAAGGGLTDWTNLASVCHGCHSQKTCHVEKLGKDRVPVKGCDTSGRPLDPEHWWNRR